MRGWGTKAHLLTLRSPKLSWVLLCPFIILGPATPIIPRIWKGTSFLSGWIKDFFRHFHGLQTFLRLAFWSVLERKPEWGPLRPERDIETEAGRRNWKSWKRMGGKEKSEPREIGKHAPALRRVAPRERLFRLLDRHAERPVIWVSGHRDAVRQPW